jgi:hypothetical protein
MHGRVSATRLRTNAAPVSTLAGPTLPNITEALVCSIVPHRQGIAQSATSLSEANRSWTLSLERTTRSVLHHCTSFWLSTGVVSSGLAFLMLAPLPASSATSASLAVVSSLGVDFISCSVDRSRPHHTSSLVRSRHPSSCCIVDFPGLLSTVTSKSFGVADNSIIFGFPHGLRSVQNRSQMYHQ